MSKLIELIKALLPSADAQHDRDEAYLAKAVDVCDLERRMRHLDDEGRASPLEPGLTVGLR